MIHLQYRYKFYLNLNHAITIANKLGTVHPHTWEITLDITSMNSEMAQFSQIEKIMEQQFAKYQDKFLNDIPPFDHLNPTLENAGNYFLQMLQDAVAEKGWVVLMIELSETPTRSYIINVVNDFYKPKKEEMIKKLEQQENVVEKIEIKKETTETTAVEETKQQIEEDEYDYEFAEEDLHYDYEV